MRILFGLLLAISAQSASAAGLDLAVSSAEPVAFWQTYATPQDTYAQWIMAIISLVATFISIWAVWLVRKTLNATKEVGRDQARAYVHIERAELRWGNSQGDYPSFTLAALNTGQTPAKWFECGAVVFTRPLNEDGLTADDLKFSDIDFSGLTSHRWNALGSNKELSFGIASKFSQIASKAYGRKDVSLDIAGVLRYETFFGEIFESEFWFTRRPPPAFAYQKRSGSDALASYGVKEMPHQMQRAAGSLRTYRQIS